MIYTELTVKAARIAYEKHHGQFDKIGMPYVFHPMHVAEMMDDEISTCVALLHDVVEDTDMTFEELEKEFPEEVIGPLRLLTHEKGEDYLEYVRGVKADNIALKVKKADMAHNTDEQRMKLLNSPEKEAYFRRKYGEAWKLLNE